MSQPNVPIADRLAALEEAAGLAAGHLNEDVVGRARQVGVRASERLRHGTHHTVVALAGPTGAGKSTLFNAIVGADVSQTGVRRPTTSEAHAAVFDGDGSAGPLLDWLGVNHRHHVPAPDNRLSGLVLLDLPDYDSTEALNRAEVDRLVQLVDLVVWVVDPQKYADHLLHDGYLRPLASHAEVMRFVLSKADTLDDPQREALVRDLGALVAEDGIPGADIMPLSLLGADPAGLVPVTAMLQQVVHEQRSTVERLNADIAAAANAMRSSLGAAATTADVLSRPERNALVEGLGRAAAIDATAAAVANQHRQDARLAMGWPLTRWMTKFRSRPIAERPIARTSAVAEAEVGQAVRLAGEQAAESLPGQWTTVMRATAEAQKPQVLAALDTVTHRTVAVNRTPPRWWSLVTAGQYIAIAVAAVGAAWLVALALVDGFLRIDVDVASPQVGSVPLPSLLLLGGVGVGLVVAALSALLARVGASRRARAIRQGLAAELEEVADAQVIEPLRRIRQEHDGILTSLDQALCS